MRKFRQANVDFMLTMFEQEKTRYNNSQSRIDLMSLTDQEVKIWDDGYGTGYAKGYQAATRTLKEVFEQHCLI